MKGCCYCDLDKYENNIYRETKIMYLSCGEYTGLTMEYRKGIYRLAAHGEDETRIEIEYCPFCGRKLTENDDE